MTVADDLRALKEQATEGPWLRLMHNRVFIRPDDRTEEPVANCIFGDDAEFIAAAANLWPLLCDLVQAADRFSASYPLPTPPREPWSDCDTYAEMLREALAALAQAAAK